MLSTLIPYFSRSSGYGPALRKGIRKPDPFHGNRKRLNQALGNGAAETPDNGVLLRGHDRSGFTGATLHQRVVQGFDGMHFHNPHREPFGGE